MENIDTIKTEFAKVGYELNLINRLNGLYSLDNIKTKETLLEVEIVTGGFDIEDAFCNECIFDLYGGYKDPSNIEFIKDIIKKQKHSKTIESILDHYIICALWSSVDDNDTPLDDIYDETDIHEDSKQEMRETCTKFFFANKDLLDESKLSPEQIGHDLWLTRNGHGTGFWDRGLNEIGDKLTEICRVLGYSDLYSGDNGLLYINN